ncbi:hypothetical protein HUU42_03375 [bacterium]|nr:hypothetical protein [bacterium]
MLQRRISLRLRKALRLFKKRLNQRSLLDAENSYYSYSYSKIENKLHVFRIMICERWFLVRRFLQGRE